jgi:lysophospholipase L1-like esterase
MPRQTRRLAKPALAIGTSLICLLVAEFALRRIAPLQDPYAADKVPREGINQYIKSEHAKNLRLVTEPEADLPGMHGPNVFTTNNLGFRGEELTIPKPANEFRIFMVGGSTTECLYLDDTKAITTVLQNELNKQRGANLQVRVYGAGKSGDASDDHCSMIVHRIVQLQPDMIIVFAGINDLTRGIVNYDYLHYVKDAPAERLRQLKYLATESQIVRRFYYLFRRNPQNITQVFQEIHLRSDFREKVRLCNSLPLSNERPRVDLTAYANNLRTIAGVAQAHQIKLVLMTQQSTWNGPDDANVKEWQWLLCRSGIRYREDYMNEALTALNDQTRQVAREFSVPVYDLALTMPKSRDFFYDDVHFNDRGAQEAAVGLAMLIGGMNIGSTQTQGR